jgi:hypothetical protein
MQPMKHAKIVGRCLAGLCLTAAFAFGTTASASAKVLLFVPSTEATHVKALSGPGVIRIGPNSFNYATVHILEKIILGFTLSRRIRYLAFQAAGIKCNTAGEPEGVVLLDLLGHLGLADPGDVPAVLWSVPSGFEFICGGLVTAKLRGSVISLLTKPALLKAGETEVTTKFDQSEGKQSQTSFLLGNTLLTNQFLEGSISGGAFEQGSIEEEATLKATSGSFELRDE